MAISVKPNQALGFNLNDDCKCGGDYCQPIQSDDLTMLQGNVTEGSGVNLVEDGNFAGSGNWDLDTGWSILGGKLHATNIGPGATADSILPIGLVAGKLYLIKCQITVTSQGSAGPNQGFIIKVNDQALELPTATAYNQSLTASWLFMPSAITTDIIQFSTNESTIDFDVEYIRVYELSELGLGIYTSNGILDSAYTTFTGNNSLKYYFNGQRFISGSMIWEGDFDELSNLVMFELLINDWASLTTIRGCLTIRLYDTLSLTQRIRNGTFTGSLNYWTVGANWAYSGANSATYVGGLTLLEQTLGLMGGNSYTLTFGTTNLGLGNSMALCINGTPIARFFGNGTQTYTLDLTAYSGLLSITLGFTGDVVGGDHTYILDNVSLVGADKDNLNVSGCINLRDTHTCTLLFYALNFDNAFGFDYTSGALRHYLRLEAKMDISGFPEEKEDYLFSDNSRKLLFARSETEIEINLTDAPDYIHACLRMMRLNDVFQIDGTEYVADNNYDLKRRKSSKLKQAVFTVKAKDGIASNYSCT